MEPTLLDFIAIKIREWFPNLKVSLESPLRSGSSSHEKTLHVSINGVEAIVIFEDMLIGYWATRPDTKFVGNLDPGNPEFFDNLRTHISKIINSSLVSLAYRKAEKYYKERAWK
jgi:hypothetical protein